MRIALNELVGAAAVHPSELVGDPNNAAHGVTWNPWTPTAPRRLVFDATLQQAAISEE